MKKIFFETAYTQIAVRFDNEAEQVEYNELVKDLFSQAPPEKQNQAMRECIAVSVANVLGYEITTRENAYIK